MRKHALLTNRSGQAENWHIYRVRHTFHDPRLIECEQAGARQGENAFGFASDKHTKLDKLTRASSKKNGNPCRPLSLPRLSRNHIYCSQVVRDRSYSALFPFSPTLALAVSALKETIFCSLSACIAMEMHLFRSFAFAFSFFSSFSHRIYMAKVRRTEHSR